MYESLMRKCHEQEYDLSDPLLWAQKREKKERKQTGNDNGAHTGPGGVGLERRPGKQQVGGEKERTWEARGPRTQEGV